MNDDLIARLERATEGSRELDAEIWCLIHGHKFIRMADPDHNRLDPLSFRFVYDDPCTANVTCWYNSAYSRSLDAALSLAPEGHDWIVADVNGHVGGTPYACVGSKKPHFAETPALALCIAALKARG